MQSAHWPHCDATHHTVGGNGPKIIELDEDKTYMLCRCFKSQNKPFCDGSHKGSEFTPLAYKTHFSPA